tara:strand:+ start:181 stop:1251 length:1071 start_codon:yes stop_codon:yes gene_type:complete
MIINIIPTIEGGGAEIIVQEIHKIYLSKNIESHLIYFSGKNNNLQHNSIVLGLSRKNPFIVFYLRKTLKKLIGNKRRRVIVHVHLTWAFFYTVIAAAGLKNIKLFYTEHDTTNRRRNIPFFHIIDRFFYSRYSRVICISQGVHRALAMWVGNRIKKKLLTIPNGSRIYTLYSRTSIENRLPKLVSIGSLVHKKNFSTSIYAVSRLKNEIESYTIIGEGPERLKLEKLIDKLKLKEKVKLIGWSNNVEQHLYNSDIQLIPSLIEGFGLVASEGMSTGLPIVASNIEGLTEVLGCPNPSVTLVNKIESIEEWKEGILNAINNINEIGIKKISKFSSTQAKKFTFEKMVERYLDIYTNQ